jgi:5,10-methylenetetrahydromethanopterin reductase
MRVDFAVGMGRNERADEIAGLARLADDRGFAHMTLVDEPYLARDVSVMATAAVLATRRIRVGQGVVDPATYHPSALANAAASLGELSGGRAFLGLGAGGPFGKLMKPLPHADLRAAALFVRKFLAGEEAEFKGGRMQSEWIRRPVPIYLAADGPRALELAGEVADGVYFMGGPPALVKWKVEQIYRGAERAGRDPSRLDICVRSYVYVTDSKERAWREAAGFVPFGIRVLENLKKEPAIVELFERLERDSPGILDEMRRFAAAAARVTRADGYNPWFEKIDAPYARLMTQRIIDCVHMIGTPAEIRDKIARLVEAGVTTIATATYTIIDKKGMLQSIADQIMPHFRN